MADDQTTPPTPPPEIGPNPAQHQQPPSILDLLVPGAFSPLAQAQQDHGISLEHLAAWLDEPQNIRAIENLQYLLRAQHTFMLLQQQPLAMARTVELITSATSEETSRKACADLLKARI